MGSFSDYANAAALNWLFGGDADQPTAHYLALLAGDAEVSGGGYARAPVAEWTRAEPGSPASLANASSVTFPTATGDWAGGEPLTRWALYDAPDGGNLLAIGALSQAKPMHAGDVATFAPAAFSFSFG